MFIGEDCNLQVNNKNNCKAHLFDFFSCKYLTFFCVLKRLHILFSVSFMLYLAVVQTLKTRFSSYWSAFMTLLLSLASQPQGGGRVQLHPARDALQTLPVRVSRLRGGGSQGAAGAAQRGAAHSGESRFFDLVQTVDTACCVSEDSHHCWFAGQMLQMQQENRALLPEWPWGKTQVEK